MANSGWQMAWVFHMQNLDLVKAWKQKVEYLGKRKGLAGEIKGRQEKAVRVITRSMTDTNVCTCHNKPILCIHDAKKFKKLTNNNNKASREHQQRGV